jgi:exopolysaccharide biosynthesis predicted pyruvyltransferase EpsI
MMNHIQKIAQLRARIDSELDPLIPSGGTAALLDFSSYGNVGDNAIWLGQKAYLERRGVEVVYACDIETYSTAALRRAVGDGPILIQGGGNFGDMWPEHQRFREQVLEEFPSNPIVQFPQTIHFAEGGAALERAKRTLTAHRRFSLLVRDSSSLHLARTNFPANHVALCPDMAFYLGPLERPFAPSTDVVRLLRDDLEAGDRSGLEGAGHGDQTVDWIADEVTPLTLLNRIRPSRFFGPPDRDWTGSLSWLRRPLAAGFDGVARERLQRGIRTLSRGRTVTTDRLHAHIISLLLGIPHALIDNSYGKVRGYYEAWTSDCDLVRWVDPTPGERASKRAGAARL